MKCVFETTTRPLVLVFLYDMQLYASIIPPLGRIDQLCFNSLLTQSPCSRVDLNPIGWFSLFLFPHRYAPAFGPVRDTQGTLPTLYPYADTYMPTW